MDQFYCERCERWDIKTEDKAYCRCREFIVKDEFGKKRSFYGKDELDVAKKFAEFYDSENGRGAGSLVDVGMSVITIGDKKIEIGAEIETYYSANEIKEGF